MNATTTEVRYYFAISPETGQPMVRDRDGKILVFRSEAACALAAMELYGHRIQIMVGGMGPEKWEKFRAKEQYTIAEE